MATTFPEDQTYTNQHRAAAEHEDAREKHSVTPGAVRPARELLGDLFLEWHQPKEALAAWRKVLAVTPGQRNAGLGTAEAARWTSLAGEGARLPETGSSHRYLTGWSGRQGDSASQQVILQGR